MIQFQYERASTMKAAVSALASSANAKIIAGGMNLVDLMKRNVMVPTKLVEINALPLRDIQQQNGKIIVGALEINSQVADDKLILEKHLLLSKALNAGASAQIRNMATVGGNIMERTRCSYFYDTAFPCNKRGPGSGCGALEGLNRMHAIFGTNEKCIAVHPSDMYVALDAIVVVSGLKGERRIPFEEFHRLPGSQPEKDNNLQKDELIISVEIPDNAFSKNTHYYKVRDRASYAFALISVAAELDMEGNLVMHCAITDIGPGTATAMVKVASNTTGIAPEKITFHLGSSEFPNAGLQGGSSTVNSVGPAVQAACDALKEQLITMAAAKNSSDFGSAKPDEVMFDKTEMQLTAKSSAKVKLNELFKQNNVQKIETTPESKPSENGKKYSMNAFSMHFAMVHVHPFTGQVRVKKIVCCADAGTIVSPKTVESQMIGGATGGIGMALTEDAVMDHRYGRYVTKDFGDYHVPVPDIDVYFVNKPDLLADPVGSKGLGEIAIIGVAPAIANAVFNATGKRVRDLLITPDKLF